MLDNLPDLVMLLNKPCDGEPKVFFVKMVGDYYRYIAENAKGDNLGVLVYEQTIEDFSAATVIGLTESLFMCDDSCDVEMLACDLLG